MSPTTWILVIGAHAVRLLVRDRGGKLELLQRFEDADGSFDPSLVAYLDDAANDRAFERLEIVGPRKRMRGLRLKLPQTVRDRVSRVFDRDLTGVEEGELSQFL